MKEITKRDIYRGIMFVLFIYKLFRIMIWNAYKSVEVKQLTLAIVTWLIHPILLYRDNKHLFILPDFHIPLKNVYAY